MNRIVAFCEIVPLIAAAVAVVVASRNRSQPLPPPDVPVAALPAEVRVKAVERKSTTVARPNVATASRAVAIVCGVDEATVDRYEARNNALLLLLLVVMPLNLHKMNIVFGLIVVPKRLLHQHLNLQYQKL